jgi:hypothetical protein
MAKYVLLISLLYVQIINAQTIEQLDGKWSFTGLRTTVFKVSNEKLYVAMLEYADTSNFNRFVKGLPIDSSLFNESSIIKKNDSIFIHVGFPSIDHDLRLVYTTKDSTNILFTGDVFFDSTKVIVANKNCNLNNPGCTNRLYDQADLKAIMQLKTYESFSRDDAFEFLLRLNENLNSRCNKCYAGFTDAYMNGILIEMGFNPFVKRTAVHSVWYNTSGFTFYIKTKFSSDQRLVKLTDYIFDWYLKN